MSTPVDEYVDCLPLHLRAYAILADARPKSPSAAKRPKLAPASDYTVVFDTETTTDPSQHLRFGTFCVYRGENLFRSGIFWAPNAVSERELETLRRFAADNGLDLLTRNQFADDILFGIGYDLRATIVGFNLPFDISRIAISHGSARGKKMRGGFTFKISTDRRRSNIQVKHVSQRMAFINFTKPFKQLHSRSQRQRGDKIETSLDHFVDVKTLASALLSGGYSLASLSKHLNVINQKLEFDEFDGPISDDMIKYAVRDTHATWECYVELRDRFEALGLTDLRPEKAYSEASIGKACLKQMGIAPWQQSQPNFEPQKIANIVSAYFGGRSEVRIRREIKQVMLCDFLSMYPTVCSLMGLWRFVTSKNKVTRDATNEASAILSNVTLEALQSKEAWLNLAMLVRVKSEKDIFPVRTKYQKAQTATIGLNKLTCSKPLWFTLADCIASKLLTGKPPEIVEAIGYAPGTMQSGLKPINIMGNADYRINPAKDDFYKRVIELRHETKEQLRFAREADAPSLEAAQLNLKTNANSTSYGIFIENNVSDRMGKATLSVYNGIDEPFNTEKSKIEETGVFYDPLLATLITGAARLMLAITETLVSQKQLEWVFCDTDSMAIAKPEKMEQSRFIEKVQSIINWFDSLNPYGFGGSILKSESYNYSHVNGKILTPLFCFAVSAKRYVLFNMDENNKPMIRKASGHGLGHLIAPYGSNNPATGIPQPFQSVAKIGVPLWQHDLWWKIIEAALDGHPFQVDLSYHPNLLRPAMSRYAATSPALLAWFKSYNNGKAYRDQVKPFGFMLSLSAQCILDDERFFDDWSKRRPAVKPLKPIAPFTRDPEIAALNALDRVTGEPMDRTLLKSYVSVLASYHLHPENKFWNGAYMECGTTKRRHIIADSANHIGKEANNWEQQAVLGLDSNESIIY
ncbi:MAG: hypothetical protein AAGE37_03665 [Pseudomonadota bacterium]